MYKCISDNNLLSPNQSHFCTGDSRINQLYLLPMIFITNLMKDLNISKQRPLIKFGTKDVYINYVNMVFRVTYCLFPVETRRLFNVYKTSIRRRRRRIDVEMTSCVYWVLIDFFTNRKQRVVLNGQNSLWTGIKAGVP